MRYLCCQLLAYQRSPHTSHHRRAQDTVRSTTLRTWKRNKERKRKRKEKRKWENQKKRKKKGKHENKRRKSKETLLPNDVHQQEETPHMKILQIQTLFFIQQFFVVLKFIFFFVFFWLQRSCQGPSNFLHTQWKMVWNRFNTTNIHNTVLLIIIFKLLLLWTVATELS